MVGVVSIAYKIPQNARSYMSQQRIGFIQSRGLGDVVIALPIAREYTRRGYEVYWPVCEPFYEGLVRAVPWIRWMSVPVDPQGLFFYENPHRQLSALGITEELWMYQYLSSHPERTNRSWFAQFKFDQYKYASADVPFQKKWELAECITRDSQREQQLRELLDLKPRYMVYQGTASDLNYDIDLSVVEEGVQRVELREIEGYSIFDWLGVIEGAESAILIDSVFANLIDQLEWTAKIDCYYLRKWNRRVDGNPVFLGSWTYVDVPDPEGVQVQSLANTGLQNQGAREAALNENPAVRPKQAAGSAVGGAGQTYTPYGQTQNTQNAAQKLQAALGLRR